jgi:hypothetical protein
MRQGVSTWRNSASGVSAPDRFEGRGGRRTRATAIVRYSMVAACLWLVGCSERSAPVATKDASAMTAMPIPPLPPDGPDVAKARLLRIRQDVEAIETECRAAANGDWDRWEEQTAPYRAALRGRIDLLKSHTGSNSDYREALLAALDRPYFCGWASQSTLAITDPRYFDDFRKARPVAAACRWLKVRGIDLIFVASPSMTAVYIDHFIAKAPASGIVAPHMRKTTLEMLNDNVEAVDVFRIQRSRLDGDFLYVPADNHWNNVGVRGPAKDVAERLTRYAWGAMARSAPAVVKCVSAPYAAPDDGRPDSWHPVGAVAGTPEQLAAARTTFPKMVDVITSPDGTNVPDDPSSPVLLIGNSFAMGFREALVKDANLLIRTHWGNGYTTQNFIEFLRDPALLDGVRVVVWVTAEEFLPALRYLPEPIQAALVD